MFVYYTSLFFYAFFILFHQLSYLYATFLILVTGQNTREESEEESGRDVLPGLQREAVGYPGRAQPARRSVPEQAEQREPPGRAERESGRGGGRRRRRRRDLRRVRVGRPEESPRHFFARRRILR